MSDLGLSYTKVGISDLIFRFNFYYRLGTLKPQTFVLKMNPVRRIYDPRALPREFDCEETWPGYISGIQDQKWCGSSWAISTAAVASDRFVDSDIFLRRP